MNEHSRKVFEQSLLIGASVMEKLGRCVIEWKINLFDKELKANAERSM